MGGSGGGSFFGNGNKAVFRKRHQLDLAFPVRPAFPETITAGSGDFDQKKTELLAFFDRKGPEMLAILTEKVL